MFTKSLLCCALFVSTFCIVNEASAQVAGNWRGSWISQTNGHKGNLNARIRQINSNQYRAVFRGTFFKVIPFRYAAKLDVVERGPGYAKLAGGKKLGAAMGEFRYEACVQGNSFQASYYSKRDNGLWQMQRE